jgi:hypothetical protein
MHAANPALAIEHATVGIVVLWVLHKAESALLTSNFGLTSTFRSRNRTAALEKHADCLLTKMNQVTKDHQQESYGCS